MHARTHAHTHIHTHTHTHTTPCYNTLYSTIKQESANKIIHTHTHTHQPSPLPLQQWVCPSYWSVGPHCSWYCAHSCLTEDQLRPAPHQHSLWGPKRGVHVEELYTDIGPLFTEYLCTIIIIHFQRCCTSKMYCTYKACSNWLTGWLWLTFEEGCKSCDLDINLKLVDNAPMLVRVTVLWTVSPTQTLPKSTTTQSAEIRHFLVRQATGRVKGPVWDSISMWPWISSFNCVCEC